MVELMVTKQELGIRMTQMRNRLSKTSIWMLMLLPLLVACFPALPTQQVISPTTIQESGKLEPPLIIASATLARSTTTPTSMIVSTHTPALSSTPTRSIQLPTLTSAPTLSDTQKEALVLDLLHNNAGCELPCWWGFTPGKTSWETARDFFLSHGAPIETHMLKANSYITGFRINQYNFGTDITFFVDKNVIQVLRTSAETFSVQRNELIYGAPFFQKAMDRYLLSSIVASRGKPAQVIMFVSSNFFIELPDYFLTLFYPDNSLLIEYWGRSEEVGDKLRLCPEKALIHMWLWSADVDLTLEEAYSYAASESAESRKRFLEQFLSWEMVTGLDINAFVDIFKDKSTCFDTPAALWGRE